MIAWMYCVGEGRGSCEVATMSKSLPVASLFCWFCKYEVHELVYFLTFRKNGIMFCFVLLVTEVKVFYLNDPPFCFWYRNIDMSNFCVGLVGGGRDGWGELRSEPRAAHVFFIFQIKKELFIFIFQIKSISKGTFWKKGTKWQSLVNSPNSDIYHPPKPYICQEDIPVCEYTVQTIIKNETCMACRTNDLSVWVTKKIVVWTFCFR